MALTTHPELGKPNYEKALSQHARYIDTLLSCGVKAFVLEPEETYPDSCFVEDPCVIIPDKCAIITNPGATSRKGETKSIEHEVRKWFSAENKNLFHIKAPGTMDGGDLMMVGDTFYIGVGNRTNYEGVKQFETIVSQFNKKVIPVALDEGLHLKSSRSYLENNNLLISEGLKDNPLFANFNKITIPDKYGLVADSVWVNGVVIIPDGYPSITQKIKNRLAN